jgi:hypothetical protein
MIASVGSDIQYVTLEQSRGYMVPYLFHPLRQNQCLPHVKKHS